MLWETALETGRRWVAGSDRGVSPTVSLAILIAVVLTLVVALALFVFVGN